MYDELILSRKDAMSHRARSGSFQGDGGTGGSTTWCHEGVGSGLDRHGNGPGRYVRRPQWLTSSSDTIGSMVPGVKLPNFRLFASPTFSISDFVTLQYWSRTLLC
jgi:hypothetical protein